jgi:hypothetical protein
VTDIDQLYRLPLSEFTSSRNALAKTGGADVRALAKPTLPAWAVNQLYWRQLKTYDALIGAAEAQRRTHHAVLAGRKGDLRAAGKAHDAAVEAALKATLAIVTEDGHPVTEATRTGILNTLRALPGDEPPGRLTRTLQPGGFEMLAGLTIAGGRKPAPKPAPPPASARRTVKKQGAKPTVDRKAIARAKAQVDEATKNVRQAEQAARREEFEAARAARDAEKAERAAAEAREAYEAAREALEEAEAAIPPAAREREAASRRAQKAADALDAAQQALDDAKARLAELQHGEM